MTPREITELAAWLDSVQVQANRYADLLDPRRNFSTANPVLARLDSIARTARGAETLITLGELR